MADEKQKFHIGRKFVAFIITLIVLTVLGVVGKGEGMAPYIVGLFVAYTTGNVVQKATGKEADYDKGASDER